MAAFGVEQPPVLVVPARTTLRIADLFEDGAVCLTPDGTRVFVGRERLRRDVYVPRR